MHQELLRLLKQTTILGKHQREKKYLLGKEVNFLLNYCAQSLSFEWLPLLYPWKCDEKGIGTVTKGKG